MQEITNVYLDDKYTGEYRRIYVSGIQAFLHLMRGATSLPASTRPASLRATGLAAECARRGSFGMPGRSWMPMLLTFFLV
jgi:hypothetical protein